MYIPLSNLEVGVGGGGAMGFFRKTLLSANVMKKILSLTWAEQNILKALYAFKNCFCKQNIAATISAANQT